MEFIVSEEEITAAAAYEDLHVPALFRQWAAPVLDAAQIGPGCRVLDVACGTGVLAREAALRLDDDGFVAGLDVNPGMLAVAQQIAPQVAWRQGAAELLPYGDDSFDVVVSQFGLMFFQDKVGALREMMRVLAPDGRIVIAVWDSLANSEAYPIEVALLQRLAGQQAADAPRAPFVLGDRAALAKLFRDAGMESVEITTHSGTAQFPSIRVMVEADLRGWLPIMGVFLTEAQIEHILQEAEQALSQYLTPEGTVAFAAPAHIVTGTKL
ncbi:MAG: methyltransferase domain-containing protein [Chloroflexi bacterium]|nr:methyltransferase domain-containing protein [Chloroflexota bacterium]